MSQCFQKLTAAELSKSIQGSVIGIIMIEGQNPIIHVISLNPCSLKELMKIIDTNEGENTLTLRAFPTYRSYKPALDSFDNIWQLKHGQFLYKKRWFNNYMSYSWKHFSKMRNWSFNMSNFSFCNIIFKLCLNVGKG